MEVVFINVKNNTAPESEYKIGKNGDNSRLEQQEAYHTLDYPSKNKEVRPNKKRVNVVDDNNLEIDLKKRKVAKEDSVNNGKVDESILTNVLTVDECSSDRLRPKKNSAAKRPRDSLENGHSDIQCLTSNSQNDSSINTANEQQQVNNNNLSGECPKNINITETISQNRKR